MVRWAEFEAAAPEIAAEGRRLLYARGDGEALLVTVRGAELPRVHPINVGVVDGGLYAFLLPSPKRTDLERDGRFALHTHQDPAAPDEFSVRGRATGRRRRRPSGRRLATRGSSRWTTPTCSSSSTSSRRCLDRAAPTSGRRAIAAGAPPVPERTAFPCREPQYAIFRSRLSSRPYVRIAAPQGGDRDTEHGRPPCP